MKRCHLAQGPDAAFVFVGGRTTCFEHR
jgi:hypothetical protein